MQHDVFVNPGVRTRATQPFLAVLQADIASGPQRLVCPIFVFQALKPSRTVLTVAIDGITYLLPVEQVTGFPTSLLRRPVGSIAAHRDDITRVIDWLFTGV